MIALLHRSSSGRALALRARGAGSNPAGGQCFHSISNIHSSHCTLLLTSSQYIRSRALRVLLGSTALEGLISRQCWLASHFSPQGCFLAAIGLNGRFGMTALLRRSSSGRALAL